MNRYRPSLQEFVDALRHALGLTPLYLAPDDARRFTFYGIHGYDNDGNRHVRPHRSGAT